MTFQLIPPIVQFTDNLGNPVSFGVVYTAQAGTTAGPAQAFPLATFADSSGSTSLQNPIPLDAFGRCSVWLNGYYNIAVYSAAGVLVSTFENISSCSTFGNYAVASGSANALTISVTPPLSVYADGVQVSFKALYTNTDICTISAGAGVVPLLNNIGGNLTPGDLLAGSLYVALYDAAAGSFKLIFPTNIQIGHLQSIPIGAYVDVPFSTPPTGYLECDGSAISRSAYADLFTAIGVMYGSGDGTTTFNIPDFRGRFPRMWAHGATNDPDAATRTDRGDSTTGDVVGSKQAEGLKAHTHIVYTSDNPEGDTPYFQRDYTYMTSHQDIVSQLTSSTGGNETRPINMYVMRCIKY